ncbi:mpz-5 [Pristionchus pacificus]|uniref:Mpz-5 n=1 Tax=Pristionchus pacificus TaxID=54126 RepID=A0A2A6CS25_PRIPA|nr:mpz-5 [Pristionchus pacificus]|eukprot:PDM81014.1 mpz-5 [Pristionchus pacificus]
MSKRKTVDGDAGSVVAPNRFIATVSVRVKKGARLAMNVRNSDHCVSRIHPDSPLFQKINVGDRIIAVNGQKLDLQKLYESMKENKDKEKSFFITVEHLSFSWCFLRKTTLESISTEKEEKVIGRAVNVFKIVLHDFTPPEIRAPLGLQIQYDARERIEIYNVAPKSICATHLRAGDIIREVNGRSVCSKSMCMALIQQSLSASKVVTLTVETSVNGHDSYREQEEMPEDVLQIAKKQIEFLKKGGTAKMHPKGISAKISNSSTSLLDVFKKATESPTLKTARPCSSDHLKVSVATMERTEYEHSADMDPNKLKSYKSLK